MRKVNIELQSGFFGPLGCFWQVDLQPVLHFVNIPIKLLKLNYSVRVIKMLR